MSKLKPCPFCGSDDVGIHEWEFLDDDTFEHIHCNNCKAQIDDFNVKDKKAIKSWNNRPLESELLNALKLALPHIRCENNEQSSIITICGEAIEKAEQ